MSDLSAWLLDGAILMEDGAVTLCEECPCEEEEPVLCKACNYAGPTQLDVTVPPLENGFFGCTDCADLGGATYRVTAVADAAGSPIEEGVQYEDCFWELRFAEGEMPCDVRRIRVKAADRGETEIEFINGSGLTILFAVVMSGRPAECDMNNFEVPIVSGDCIATGGLPILLTAVP